VFTDILSHSEWISGIVRVHKVDLNVI